MEMQGENRMEIWSRLLKRFSYWHKKDKEQLQEVTMDKGNCKNHVCYSKDNDLGF